MNKRVGVGKVFSKASLAPLSVAILGGGIAGALVLGSWPLAALGAVAYAALVASDVSSEEFRKRVLFGRKRPAALPEAKALRDPEVRAAVERIAAARTALDRVVKETPGRIQRTVSAALAAVDELQGHGAGLALRADELSRYLAVTDTAGAARDAEALAARASHTADPTARKSYEEAAAAARERVTALRDITTARDRVLAHLTQIETALKSVPAKLVRLRALDDQASDALTGDFGAELERMNVDLRAFEDTLESIVEVPA